MKIIELTESKGYAYKTAAYRDYPMGGTEPWLKKFGATAEDVQRAREIVLSGPEFHAIRELGFADVSGDRSKKNGTIDMQIFFNTGDERRLKSTLRFKVLVHGRATGLNDGDDRRGYPIRTPEPVVIEGDPVQSIVRTMNNALKKLHTVMKSALALQKTKTSSLAPAKWLVSKMDEQNDLLRFLGGSKFMFYVTKTELQIVTHTGTKMDLYSLHADPKSLDQPKGRVQVDPAAMTKEIIEAGIESGKIPENMFKRPLSVKVDTGKYSASINIKLARQG